MRKILNCVSYLTLLLAFGLTVLIGYWLIYPYQPIVFKDNRLITQTIKQGGTLEYEVDYCKYMNLSAEVTGSYNNGIIYVTPSIRSNNPVGCHHIVVMTLVPLELPATKYTMILRYKYQVNPIRTVEYEVVSKEFEVVAR